MSSFMHGVPVVTCMHAMRVHIKAKFPIELAHINALSASDAGNCFAMHCTDLIALTTASLSLACITPASVMYVMHACDQHSGAGVAG